MGKASSETRDPHNQAEGAEAGDGRQELMHRAPSGFLWFQAFILWLFLANLLSQIVVRHTLSGPEAGVFSLVASTANFAVYLAQLGLGNAAAVYIPRAIAEGRPRQALAVATRLIFIRLGAVLLIAVTVLWALPWLVGLLALTGLPVAVSLGHTLNDQTLRGHSVALAGYVIAFGMSNLLQGLMTAVLRTRIVLILSSVTQVTALVLTYVFTGPLHGGPDGAILAQALPVAGLVVAYALVLRHTLTGYPAGGGQRSDDKPPHMGPVLRLGLATWLSDLASGSLVTLVAQAQLVATLIAIGYTTASANLQNAYFTSALQLGHAAALVGIEGLGGVSIAIMSAAYANRHLPSLATGWRTISKLHVLLAVPLVAFCVPHANAIISVFGTTYTQAGPLLAVFLAMNALIQLVGGGGHEPVLYVLGKQHWAVISRWGSLGLLALLDVLLIPRYGALGALLAVGIAQVAAEVFQLLLVSRSVARPYPITFILRILAAMVVPMVFSVLWRPASLVGLVAAGLGYAAILIVCLRLIRPLDAEDNLLLNQVAAPLRAILRSFVAPARPDAAASSAISPLGSQLAAPVPAPVSGPISPDKRPAQRSTATFPPRQ